MTEFNPVPIEHNVQRVLTTSQLAEVYGTTAKNITDNFKNNKSCYVKDVHFYRLTGEGLKALKSEIKNFGILNERTSCLYLWTEKGSLLHARSINTDNAWKGYEYLDAHYFRTEDVLLSYNLLKNLIENQRILNKKTDDLKNTVNAIDKKINAIDKYIKILEKKHDNFENHIIIPFIKGIIKFLK